MELCNVILPYGSIWILCLTVVILKYRRRKYPVFLYFANLLLYVIFYFKRCQHLSVSVQFHDKSYLQPDENTELRKTVQNEESFLSDSKNYRKSSHKNSKLQQTPNNNPLLVPEPQMPNGWETARHSVKQNYVDRHVKTAGQNYKEYLKSATYETLPVEQWEAAELKKGGFQEIWFSGVQGVEKNKINESATNRGLDFPEEDEEEGGKYSALCLD